LRGGLATGFGAAETADMDLIEWTESSSWPPIP